MASNKFAIIIRGDDQSDGLRLSALVDQLEAVRQVLVKVESSLIGKHRQRVFYRINKITMNSPATFEIEAVSKGDNVLKDLKSSIDSIGT